jgi:transglutaminase-like putative cysteine protease
MKLDVGCELIFDVTDFTPFLLMLRPRSGYGQWVSEERYTLSPLVPVVEYLDPFSNLCQRLVAPGGRFVVTASAVVETAEATDIEPGAPFTLVQNLPENALQFLLPSRYCQSDMVGGLARQIIGDALPGYDQVELIRGWIHQNIEYRYGSSNASTSALETASEKVGVCRDFAHLGIALCRSLNIPARIVVGYLQDLEPMDVHAWFEAYVAGRWYTFDATQEHPRGGRIAIAYGRDAADVALATQFGPATLAEMRVWVKS